MSRYSGNISFDLDVNEVLSRLDRFDREDLYSKLKAEFGKKSDTPLGDCNSYYDEELSKVLLEIWSNRNYLTQEQRARINSLSKEKFV
jgi:hypothetical protein